MTRTPELRVGNDEVAGSLTEEHATFDRRDIVRAIAQAARQGASLDEILVRAEEFIASEQAIVVAEGRWTTPEILALERGVVGLAAGEAQPMFRAGPATVERSVHERPSLTDEQRVMVNELCLAGRPIDVVIGRAGAGKTFTLDAVREAFEASGHRVLGVSLAARAARELQAGAGIRSTTAHSLLAPLESGRARLREGDVVVVDEAGMLGTRVMASLADEAARAKAKIILVGDPKQLPAVAAGGLFAALADRVPVVELKQNRRQRDPHEQLITAALRAGRTELAVRCLDEHGRITVAHNSDTLRDQMVLDWWEHRTAGQDVVIGAVHRSDVRDLNSRIHGVLEAAGRLGPVVATVEEQRFCVGDQILTLENRYDLGVLNGDLAEITGAGEGGLHARGEAGREVHLPLDYVSEHVQHAYARTVHKTQGLTCDVALLLGDDGLYAELGYTGLTRGCQENHLYTVVTTQEFESDSHELADLVRTLDTSRAKSAAIDYLEPMEIS